MWKRLAVLGVVEFLLIGALFLPIQTHAVLIDTPDAARRYNVEVWEQGGIALMGIVFLGAAFVYVPWRAYRVVRQHRNTQRDA